MSYSAYMLSAQSREKVLNAFIPRYDPVCHHVTHKFPDNNLPPNVSEVTIIGYSVNEKVEALVVKVNGTEYRPDGKLYHITLSVNFRAGGKPVMSNGLLKHGYEIIDPFDVFVTPVVL